MDEGFGIGMNKGKKPHVLIIVENLPVPFDTRVWKEAKALRNNRYDVSVICTKGYIYTRSYEKLEGIDIYRHPVPRESESTRGYIKEFVVSLLWEFWLSWKVFFKKPFCIMQGCNPPDNIFLIAAFFRILGVKYVFDHHDLAPETYLAKFKRRDLLFALMKLLERLTFFLSDVSIATNKSYAEMAVNRGRMSPERVFIVRNGPEIHKFKPVEPIEALKYGKKHLVGYVGTMGEQEGIDQLIEAVQYITEKRKRNDVHCTLVGGGPALERLRSKIEYLNLNNYMNLIGRIPDKDLIEVLSTSDVCVNPDIPNPFNDKSTMIKIMEYMALGKPIVQFDMTEGRYSAQNASLYAKNGSVEDFANKILWLLDHPEERTKMGEFGKKRVREKLAWEYSVPNLLKAYEKALMSADFAD